MKNKFLLIALLSMPLTSFAGIVIMIPHTSSLITFLKGLSIKWAADVSKGMFAAAEKLPDGSQIIRIAAKFPGKGAIAKKVVEAAAKDPEKAIITAAGVMSAAGGIVEYKIASVGVEKGIEIAKQAKKSMDESKLAEKKDEETTSTPYYDETV